MEQLREDYTGTNPSAFIMLEAEETIFKTSTLEGIQSLTELIKNLSLSSQEDLTALGVTITNVLKLGPLENKKY